MNKDEVNRGYQELKAHIRKYVPKNNLSVEDINKSSLKDPRGFYRLLKKLSKHLNKEDVHALLEWYIKYDNIESNLRNKDSRFYTNDMFASLLSFRIEGSAANDKFILSLLSGIKNKIKSKPISKYILRFDRLDDVQRSGIKSKLDTKYKEYKSFSILSQLEALYHRTSKSSFIPPENEKVDVHDLVDHDFLSDKALFNTFKEHARKLGSSYSNSDWNGMLGEINSFNQFIHPKSANEKLQLFVWAWRGITIKVGYDSLGEFKSIEGRYKSINAEIYWLCFYHAVLGLTWRRRLTVDEIIGERDEKEILKAIEHLRYSSNYLFRYIAFRKQYTSNNIKKDSAFIEEIKLTLFSQIYAKKLGYKILTAEKQYHFARKVQKTYKEKDKANIRHLKGFRRDIQLGEEVGSFTVLGIHQPKIDRDEYLFYVCDRNHPFIIMVMSDAQMTDASNATVFDLVYKKTRGMMRVIAFYFEVLGYMPVFISGGFLGLLKEVVIDIAVAHVVDNTVANMGLSAAGETFVDAALRKRGVKIGVPKVVDPLPRKSSNVRSPLNTKGSTPEPSAKSIQTGTANKLTEPLNRLTRQLADALKQNALNAKKLKIELDLLILRTELNANLDIGKNITSNIKELDSKIKKIKVVIQQKLGTRLTNHEIIQTISVSPHLVQYRDFEKHIKDRILLQQERAKLIARRSRLEKNIKAKVEALKIALVNYYRTNPSKVKPVTKPGDTDPILYSINDPNIAKNIDNPQEWGTTLQKLADGVPHVIALDKPGKGHFYVYDNVLLERHFPHSGQGHRIVSNTTSRSSDELWSKYKKIFSRLDTEHGGPKFEGGNLPGSGHTKDRGKIKVAIDRLVDMEHLGHHNGSLTARHRELVRRSALGVIEAPGNITAAEFKISLRRKLTAPKGKPLLVHLAELDVGILDYVTTLKTSKPPISNKAIIDHLLDKVLRIAVY